MVISPVIDLTSFSFIDDLSIGVNNFVSFGNTEKIFKVTYDDLVPLIKNASKDKDISIKIKNIITHFNKYIQSLQTARGNDLFVNKTIMNIRNDIEYLKDNIKAQYKPIINEIEKLIAKLDNGNKILNLVNSIELAVKFNLYQQAYSLIIETFITFILYKLNLDFNDKEKRDLVKKSIKIVYDKIFDEPEKWIGIKEEQIDKVKTYIDFCKKIPENILQLYNELNDLRNDFMHSGFRKDARDADFLIKKLEKRNLIIEYIEKNIG